MSWILKCSEKCEGCSSDTEANKQTWRVMILSSTKNGNLYVPLNTQGTLHIDTPYTPTNSKSSVKFQLIVN